MAEARQYVIYVNHGRVIYCLDWDEALCVLEQLKGEELSNDHPA